MWSNIHRTFLVTKIWWVKKWTNMMIFLHFCWYLSCEKNHFFSGRLLGPNRWQIAPKRCPRISATRKKLDFFKVNFFSDDFSAFGRRGARRPEVDFQRDIDISSRSWKFRWNSFLLRTCPRNFWKKEKSKTFLFRELWSLKVQKNAVLHVNRKLQIEISQPGSDFFFEFAIIAKIFLKTKKSGF